MALADASLPAYVRQKLKKVIESTGYPVVIEDVDVLEFDSEVRYGSIANPRHHIRISKAYAQHRAHFILSSMVKVQRFSILHSASDGCLSSTSTDGCRRMRKTNYVVASPKKPPDSWTRSATGSTSDSLANFSASRGSSCRGGDLQTYQSIMGCRSPTCVDSCLI